MAVVREVDGAEQAALADMWWRTPHACVGQRHDARIYSPTRAHSLEELTSAKHWRSPDTDTKKIKWDRYFSGSGICRSLVIDWTKFSSVLENWYYKWQLLHVGKLCDFWFRRLMPICFSKYTECQNENKKMECTENFGGT